MSEVTVLTEVVCSECENVYNVKTLYEYLKTYGNSCGEYGYITSTQIQDQLDMALCGSCRVKNAPCFGCQKCCAPDTEFPEMCPNCLHYGFNHRSNIGGKCLNCA